MGITGEYCPRISQSECVLYWLKPKSYNNILYYPHTFIIANEPAERRRSAGEAAENSAARRMAYAKKFSIEL